MSDLQPGVDPDLEADQMGRFQLTFSYVLGHPRLAEALQAAATAVRTDASTSSDVDLTDVLAEHGIELPPGSTVSFANEDGATADDSPSALFTICVFVGDHMVCVEFNSPIVIQ